MSILPKINVDDVPAREARPVSGLAIVGKPSVREISNGYVQISLPLHYTNGETTQEQLSALAETVLGAYENDTTEQTLDALGLRTFVARWNLRPEWFESDFAERIKAGLVSDSERIQYQINMSGLTRSLFQAVGASAIDFNALGGQVVGFRTRPRRNEPDRLDISGFYPANRPPRKRSNKGVS